jgi:hypothetical protein
MSQVPMIHFPVICPICFQESVAARELASIAEAMLSGAPIFLESRCHRVTWTAGRTEREQIRQYLAAGVCTDDRI